MEFLDNGVFNTAKGVSSASGRGREKQTRRPQLLSVGPARVEAAATYLALGFGEARSDDSASGFAVSSAKGPAEGSAEGSWSERGEGKGEGPLETAASPTRDSQVRVIRTRTKFYHRRESRVFCSACSGRDMVICCCWPEGWRFPANHT